MDLQPILESLLRKVESRPVQDVVVSQESLTDFASRMAQRGYIPSEQTLMAVEKYLQGYGLWLTGGVGTGKTAFFRCLPLVHPPRIFPMISTLGKSVDELRDWLHDNADNEIVLDDIGSEPVFNSYGSKFEILPWMLEARMESRARTHVTSNLTAKMVLDRYGARVIDRFAEYFYRVDFTGKSKRFSRPRVILGKIAVCAVPRVSGGKVMG